MLVIIAGSACREPRVSAMHCSRDATLMVVIIVRWALHERHVSPSTGRATQR
jgi:hypothetical protein